MVVLGLILLVLCLVLGAGIALSNTDPASAEAFGVSLSNVSIGGLFLLGAALGAVAMLGFGLMLVGGARKRARKLRLKREVKDVRSEQETLAEENARLQAQLEAERSSYPPGGGAGASGVQDPGVQDSGVQDPDSGDADVRGKHAR